MKKGQGGGCWTWAHFCEKFPEEWCQEKILDTIPFLRYDSRGDLSE